MYSSTESQKDLKWECSPCNSGGSSIWFLHLSPFSGFTAAFLLRDKQMIKGRRSIKNWKQGPTLAIRFLDKHITNYWCSHIAWSSWEMPDLLHMHISTNHEAHNTPQLQHTVWHAWLPWLAHQAGHFKTTICAHVCRNVSFICLWILTNNVPECCTF